MFGVNENQQNRGFWQSRFLHLVLIVLVGVMAYSNTLIAPFYFDDVNVIVGSPIVKDLSYFYSPSKLNSIYSDYKENLLILMNSRPFGYLTFALNYKINGLNVFGYHVVNIVIHLANGILIYLLTRQLLPSQQKSNSFIGLLAGMLFASHPLATQSVTYIVQRFTSLATMFYLFSLLMYLKFKDSNGRRSSIAYYSLAMISASLGMLTKEITFTLPIMVTLAEMVFYKSDAKQRIKNLAPFIGLALLFVLLLFGCGADAFRGQSSMSRLEYFFTQLRVMATYLRLLIFPINQAFLYDYPANKTFFSLPVMLSALLHALLIASSIYLVFRSRAEWRIAGFGILWFYITSLVESSILPINDVIFEHRTYLPYAGLFIAFASVMSIIYKRLKAGLLVFIPIAFSVALVLVFGVATYERNALWRNEIRFWEDNQEKSPGLAGVHYQLGVAYASRRDFDKAIGHFQIALEINPNYHDARVELANSYIDLRSYDSALQQLNEALRIKQNSSTAFLNIGIIYIHQRRFEQSIGYLKKALEIAPQSAGANLRLGTAYYNLKQHGNALAYLQKAVQSRPDDQEAHNYLGMVYINMGNAVKAIEHFRTASMLSPSYVAPHMNLGYIYISTGDFETAMKEFETVLKINPNNAEASQYLKYLKR